MFRKLSLCILLGLLLASAVSAGANAAAMLVLVALAGLGVFGRIRGFWPPSA